MDSRLLLIIFSNCRNPVYDSSMGNCLQALHCSSPDDIVKLTAVDLVKVFPKSMQRTKSSELKVNLLKSLNRINKKFGKLIDLIS